MSFSMMSYYNQKSKRQDYHLWGEECGNPFILICEKCGKKIDIRVPGAFCAVGCPGDTFEEARMVEGYQ